MWYSAGKFILKNRIGLLIILLLATGFMGWEASKVKLSYDFSRALPTDNPKFLDYQAFLKKFGGDGNMMVIGIESEKFYSTNYFNQLAELHHRLKKVPGVTEILSIPEVINLENDSINKRLSPVKVFHAPYTSQAVLDSDKAVFENLPFYKQLLYNPEKHSYLMGVNVNKDTINSDSRTRLINDILAEVESFEKKTGTEVNKSGLPFIRTTIGNRIKDEMRLFLIGSLVLLVITMFLFFRSISATIMSLIVVCMGVIWSMGTIVLL
jgi:hypothetical protein